MNLKKIINNYFTKVMLYGMERDMNNWEKLLRHRTWNTFKFRIIKFLAGR